MKNVRHQSFSRYVTTQLVFFGLIVGTIGLSYLFVTSVHSGVSDIFRNGHDTEVASTDDADEQEATIEADDFVSEAGKGARLYLPEADCHGEVANVNFSWTPVAGSSQQWLDLSLADNGFEPGSFLASGPIDGGGRSLPWDGLVKGEAHFWRVNSLTEDGWVPSETGAFVACGAPTAITGTINCQPDRTATVNFRWAHATGTSVQWLDLSTAGRQFEPETYVGNGPLPPEVHDYSVPAFVSGVRYYFRVNAMVDGEWRSTPVAELVANCG